jgi:hypothetical protein
MRCLKRLVATVLFLVVLKQFYSDSIARNRLQSTFQFGHRYLTKQQQKYSCTIHLLKQNHLRIETIDRSVDKIVSVSITRKLKFFSTLRLIQKVKNYFQREKQFYRILMSRWMSTTPVKIENNATSTGNVNNNTAQVNNNPVKNREIWKHRIFNIKQFFTYRLKTLLKFGVKRTETFNYQNVVEKIFPEFNGDTTTTNDIDVSHTSNSSVNTESNSTYSETIGFDPPFDSNPYLSPTSNVSLLNDTDVTRTTTASNRSDCSPNGTDLSGSWEIIVDNKFKEQFDKYLTILGQSSLVRYVALAVIGMSTEETIQSDNGKSLFIRGTTAKGVWERTLHASTYDDTVRINPIITAELETVQAEAWWDGHIHVSWLIGVQKYGGGSFESYRYLTNDNNILVCESTFHPVDPSREKATVTWKFRRMRSNKAL